MKIGFCAGLNDLAKLDNCGLDYFETSVTGIMDLDEKAFAEAKEFLQTLKTPVKVCNVLLPGNLKVVGPEYNAERCRDYLERALLRVKEIGVELVVFGSGGAKRIPDGFDRDRAMEQLTEFTKILARTAEKYDLLIVIEALRKAECNCINSLDEAEWLCDTADSGHVAVLADWYHMYEEGDSPARMEALGSKLRHVHIARPDSRHTSFVGDGADYSEFFAALARMGYDGGISSEGNAEDIVDGCMKYVAFIHENLK